MIISSASKEETPKHWSKAIYDVAKSSPGLQYMMMQDSKVIAEINVGLADVANKRPVNSETLFNANSVTKTFTAVAIMELVEGGRLRLEDPVSAYVADIPFQWDITVEQLLSHTSGLKNPIPLRWIHLHDEHDQFDAGSFLRSVLADHHAQSWKPGTRYRYSNINYLLLGYIIEKVSGMPYQAFVQTTVLDSLATELSFGVNHYRNYAYGYQRRFTLMSALLGFFLDEEKFIDSQVDGWLKFKPFYNNGAAYGGLIGNARSFNLYLQELMREDSGIIAPDLRLKMLTPHPATKGRMTYSWFTGVLGGRQYYCHAGGGGGHYCEIRLYPDLKVSSVIMLNRSGMSDERVLDKVDPGYLPA